MLITVVIGVTLLDGRDGVDVSVERDFATVDNQFLTALKRDNAISVRKLINKDPERVHKPIFPGMKPVHIASSSGSLAALRVVVKHGADVNQRMGGPKPFGERTTGTPLWLAVKNGHRNVAKFLLSHGAKLESGMPDVDIRDVARREGMEDLFDRTPATRQPATK
jgi:ankyrin repeat protein